MEKDGPARPERRTTLALVAVTATAFLGVGATLPVLPGYVRGTLHGGTGTLGLALGVLPAAALIGRLIAGRVSDIRGRATTLRLGLVCGTAAGVLYTLPLGVPGLLAARILHGLTDAVVYTAVGAWVVDTTPEERRAQNLSLLGSGVWGGYAAGPLLGGLLGQMHRVGVAVAVLGVVGLVAMRWVPAAPPPVPHPTGRRTWVPRAAVLPGIALGLGNLGYAALVGYLVLRLRSGGASQTQAAAALAAFSIAVLLGRLAIVPLAVRVGLLRSLPWSRVVMAAGLVTIAASDRPLPGLVGAALFGLGYCVPFPALATSVTGQVDPAERGSALAALTGFYDVFLAVGSFADGLLAARTSTGVVFLTAAGEVLLAVAADTVLRRRSLTAGWSGQGLVGEPLPEV